MRDRLRRVARANQRWQNGHNRDDPAEEREQVGTSTAVCRDHSSLSESVLALGFLAAPARSIAVVSSIAAVRRSSRPGRASAHSRRRPRGLALGPRARPGRREAAGLSRPSTSAGARRCARFWAAGRSRGCLQARTVRDDRFEREGRHGSSPSDGGVVEKRAAGEQSFVTPARSVGRTARRDEAGQGAGRDSGQQGDTDRAADLLDGADMTVAEPTPASAGCTPSIALFIALDTARRIAS